MSPPRPPIDPATVEAWIGIFKVQKMALNEVERRLKAARLPPLIWYDVLWELKRSNGPLRPKQMEKRLLLSQYNLSRLLGRMEKQHLLKKSSDPEDGRGWLISLTSHGAQMQEKMWPVYANAIQSIVGDSLNSRESKSLANMLNRIFDDGMDRYRQGRIKKGAKGAPIDQQ